MATNIEIVAAILTAGMLPRLPIPFHTSEFELRREDEERITRTVTHAVSLYSTVLAGLRVRATRTSAGDDDAAGSAPSTAPGPRTRQRRR